MIKRTPSKINSSLVNSSFEEHFNIVKAIKDDAPITSTDSVVKSVNFEADTDGAYILRKPLIKAKSFVDTKHYLLPDKINFLQIKKKSVSATGGAPIFENVDSFVVNENTQFTLRFYDNKLILHELSSTVSVQQTVDFLPIRWLTIRNYKLLSDHILFSCEIDHVQFLKDVDALYGTVNATTSYNPNPTITGWNWTLVTDTWVTLSQAFKNLNTLKRFVKVYPKEGETNSYVLEIVNPELNTMTSGLDVGNAESLDINLLLDNPYAIRDLYGYGYVSCTKILPYIFKSKTKDYTWYNYTYMSEDFAMWQLTESDEYFTILESARDSTIADGVSPDSRNVVFLKAFLTTTVSGTVEYYCCWEQSTDEGITWEECTAFTSKFANSQTTPIVEKLVSDLSAADFNEKLKDENLEGSVDYLVVKKVVKLNLGTNDYSSFDMLKTRPDVLMIKTSDLKNTKYRFSIYVKSNSTNSDIYRTVKIDNFQSFLVESSGIITGEVNMSSTSAYVSEPVLTLPASAVSAGSDLKVRPDATNHLTLNINTEKYPQYKFHSISLQCSTKSADHYGSAIISNFAATPLSHAQVVQDANNQLELDSWRQIGSDYYPSYTHAQDSWVPALNSSNLIVHTYADTSGVENTCVYIANVSAQLYLDRVNEIPNFATVTGTSDLTKCPTPITGIIVKLKVKDEYANPLLLISQSAAFQVKLGTETNTPDSLATDRNQLFAGSLYFNDKQQQLFSYKDNSLYVSGTNSSIFKLMNSFTFPETITKLLSWRNYILIFTTGSIYLASYVLESDSYSLKILSNSVGLPVVDAETAVPILNSVYFKSGTKIYKLVPNLYATSDDVLNIQQISFGINNILEDIVNNNTETKNIHYANSDEYRIFIPVQTEDELHPWLTYVITYDFNAKTWTLQTYTIQVTDVEVISTTKAYLITDTVWYFFKDSMKVLLTTALKDYIASEELDLDYKEILPGLLNAVIYADYLTLDPKEIVELYYEDNSADFEDLFKPYVTRIPFEIDFGQKSSNYTVDKQFVETKLILATLSSKDTFPLELDIMTDGIQRPIHIDANTDGAFWKTDFNDMGILNTEFAIANADFNGIFRQLFVKYSGKGKTIRHIISGTSDSLFKFYSMNIHARILPKKR